MTNKNRIKRYRGKIRKNPSKTTQLNLVRNGGFEFGQFFPWRDVGNVDVRSGFPRRGQHYAFFLVHPSRNASITQLIHLGSPGPRREYVLSFYIARTSFETNGNLIISFTNSLQPPIIIPFQNILLAQYRYRIITIPAVAFRGASTTELRFEVNGFGPQSVSLALDDVRIVPV